MVVPKLRTVTNGECCFIKAAPSIWNVLSEDVKHREHVQDNIKTNISFCVSIVIDFMSY